MTTLDKYADLTFYVNSTVRDALSLRRIRLDIPISTCYTFARERAAYDFWDALMREHPTSHSQSTTTQRSYSDV